MRIEVSADWKEVEYTHMDKARTVVRGHRIEIAGYTAVVEKTKTTPVAYEFTVLQDHVRIVEVGLRESLEKAKSAAEAVIQDDIAGRG